MRVVGLIRDDVRPLDVMYAFDPGQSCKPLIVRNISFRLEETERETERDV